jgi:hypothetical protein
LENSEFCRKKIFGPSSLEPSENEIITKGQIQNEQQQPKNHFIQKQFTPGIFNNCYCFFVAPKLHGGLISFQAFLCSLTDRDVVYNI